MVSTGSTALTPGTAGGQHTARPPPDWGAPYEHRNRRVVISGRTRTLRVRAPAWGEFHEALHVRDRDEAGDRLRSRDAQATPLERFAQRRGREAPVHRLPQHMGEHPGRDPRTRGFV